MARRLLDFGTIVPLRRCDERVNESFSAAPDLGCCRISPGRRGALQAKSGPDWKSEKECEQEESDSVGLGIRSRRETGRIEVRWQFNLRRASLHANFPVATSRRILHFHFRLTARLAFLH